MFTDALSVTVGGYIQASHYNDLADNPEWNREKADVGHDFNITTGDGYHRGDYSNPLILKSSAAYGALWIDDTDAGNIVLRALTGASVGAVTPSAKTDGVAIGVGGFSI